MTDSQLLGLLKTSDKSSFDELYRRYFSTLYTFAYKIVQDKEACRDAVQDIFIWLWENRETLDIDHLKNYLVASVKYKLVRTIKTSKRHSEILSAKVTWDDIAFYDVGLEVKELQKVIADALSRLPVRAKEVFTLSRLQYLSNKEIAGKLGISEKTVENHITVSLRRLRTELGKILSFLLF